MNKKSADKITLSMPHDERIKVLLSNGFTYKTFEGQEGQFLLKTVSIDNMPYAGEKMVDGDYIQEGMMATTELCPDGVVQLYIADADYHEKYSFDSEDGIALLNDAIPAALPNSH